jgi:hypothetical protein
LPSLTTLCLRQNPTTPKRGCATLRSASTSHLLRRIHI